MRKGYVRNTVMSDSLSGISVFNPGVCSKNLELPPVYSLNSVANEFKEKYEPMLESFHEVKCLPTKVKFNGRGHHF